MSNSANNDRAEKIAADYYNRGIHQAMVDAGVKVAYYGDPDAAAYTMWAKPGRSARKAVPIEAPPEEELPDFSPLWSDFKVNEFADLPEDYQFNADAAQAEVQRYIDSGNTYINQVQQVYAYLLKQGMQAQDAASQAKQLVARNFQRYQLPG